MGSGAKNSKQSQLISKLGHTDTITLKKWYDQYGVLTAFRGF
ncbi:hypothetical protein [Neobacillus ginsengisoli]|uniref:Integrase n=1 Tax=Neobacillus ginsengisoli TaxID=904295 RepID=A0ABT9Y0K9_9BACI|nr:hypothetical protein [Neobacillus ginsengisoli]MDQ0201045.1 hypothetical protein [Neobacillus ginsengisoli]